MQSQQPPHATPMQGQMPPTANINTEVIQKYLEENRQLIMAIMDNQNLGKLSECNEFPLSMSQVPEATSKQSTIFSCNSRCPTTDYTVRTQTTATSDASCSNHDTSRYPVHAIAAATIHSLAATSVESPSTLSANTPYFKSS